MAEKKPLSRSQRKLWRFVRRFREKRGYPPPLPTIAEHLEVSKQAASTMIGRMVANGHLKRVDSVGSWLERGEV